MNYKPVPGWVVKTEPEFMKQAKVLAAALKSAKSLEATLKVSAKIAELNKERMNVWVGDYSAAASQPAGWAYSGDGFNGLGIADFSQPDIEFAADKLFVVSGLYGLVGLTDAVEPYRLEMETKLSGIWGKNLYEFWGDDLSSFIEEDGDWVLNCASGQYSRAVIESSGSVKVVTPEFLQQTKDGPKNKVLFSKFARGLMCKWVVQNKVSDPGELKNFDLEGYEYSQELSTELSPVFIIAEDFTLLGRFTKQ